MHEFQIEKWLTESATCTGLLWRKSESMHRHGFQTRCTGTEHRLRKSESMHRHGFQTRCTGTERERRVQTRRLGSKGLGILRDSIEVGYAK